MNNAYDNELSKMIAKAFEAFDKGQTRGAFIRENTTSNDSRATLQTWSDVYTNASSLMYEANAMIAEANVDELPGDVVRLATDLMSLWLEHSTLIDGAARELRRRIGKGNLESYLRVLRAKR